MSPPKLATHDDTPIEVFARATGKLHWLCPVCHFIHNATEINFRRPRVVCDGRWFPMPQCNRVFRLGFVFDPVAESPSVPPFNALLMPPLTSFVTNRLRRSAVAGDTSPAIAHFNGRLEYRCPSCNAWNRQRIDFTGAVQCATCHLSWRAGVLFHPPTPRTHRMHCPRDWSVTRESNI